MDVNDINITKKLPHQPISSLLSQTKKSFSPLKVTTAKNSNNNKSNDMKLVINENDV